MKVLWEVHVTPCLYNDLPAYQIAKTQRVQKPAARVVCRVPHYTHVTPHPPPPPALPFYYV